MPLPMEVIFTLLGVPEADRHQLREWMDVSLERDRDTPVIPERALHRDGADAPATGSGSSRPCADAERRPRERRCSTPRSRATTGGPTRLTDGEIDRLLLPARRRRQRDGDQAAGERVRALRAPSRASTPGSLADHALIPDAVEEVLRYTSPSQYQGRVTTRDVEWYGTTVPKGARILLLTGSANRDEREFPDPDRFDVGRRPEQHVALGYGVHFCLGASLARLESRVALEEFARRFPRYRRRRVDAACACTCRTCTATRACRSRRREPRRPAAAAPYPPFAVGTYVRHG